MGTVLISRSVKITERNFSVHDWNKQLGAKIQGVIDDMRGVTIPHDEAVQIGLKTEEEVPSDLFDFLTSSFIRLLTMFGKFY